MLALQCDVMQVKQNVTRFLANFFKCYSQQRLRNPSDLVLSSRERCLATNYQKLQTTAKNDNNNWLIERYTFRMFNSTLQCTQLQTTSTTNY